MPKKSCDNKLGWSTPEEIKSILRDKWDKGVFLNGDDTGLFPLLVSIKAPSANEITENFTEAQKWVADFEAMSENSCPQVVWEERSHRLSGKNRFPVKIHIQSTIELASFINRSLEWKNWNIALGLVEMQIPELLPYWKQQSGKCLALSVDLQKLGKLLSVCRWCRSYVKEQKERIYIRQIPLEGIHTKFVEANKSLLASWLDFLCPEHLVNMDYTKGAEFAKRYGFLERPQQVRIRILDSDKYLQSLSDLTLVAEELAQLDLGICNVFICENNVTCLSFPSVPDSILIFGAGYGFDALVKIPWLHSKRILYWGDLDTNGFCILDQLKGHFPHVESFLMDEKTLLTNKEFWSREECQSFRKTIHLNAAEYDTYQGLCNQNWGDHVRLEQELIPMSSVKAILCDMGFTLQE